jgi:hypothetical protein
MRARWKLGQLLSKVERSAGPGRGKKIPGLSESFLEFLKRLKLGWDTAQEAQRVGAMPEAELEKAFAESTRLDNLNVIAALVACPLNLPHQA